MVEIRYLPDGSLEIRVPMTHPRYDEVLRFALAQPRGNGKTAGDPPGRKEAPAVPANNREYRPARRAT